MKNQLTYHPKELELELSHLRTFSEEHSHNNNHLPVSDVFVYVLFIQAAIGSKALDMAREEGDDALTKFGLDVLTLAVLAILTTAPIGALGIGLAGPRLLARQVKGQWFL